MLPEEVTKLIGATDEPVMFTVEPGAIRKFADAIDDPNLLYWDDEYAKKTRYGGQIAPPGFFGWPIDARADSQLFYGWPSSWPKDETAPPSLIEAVITAVSKAGFRRNMDGGVEYDFFKPIRAGDTLACVTKIANIFERKGKTGSMVFVIIENSYTNQDKDLVTKARMFLIF